MKLERFKMPVAVHLFLIKGDKVLLLKRYNTGYEDGNYSVVAGHVDGNEDFVAAMIREAREEAGIEIDYSDMTPVQIMHRRSADEERIDYFLAARKWDGEITNMEPHKCEELRWFDISDLPVNMVPYVRYGIEKFKEGGVFTLFGWDT